MKFENHLNFNYPRDISASSGWAGDNNRPIAYLRRQRVCMKGRSAGVLAGEFGPRPAAQARQTARRDAFANPPARTPALLVHSQRSALYAYALLRRPP